MPSSHAANAFGQAILFALQLPRLRTILLACAATIAVSRVFVGVHYPGDILVGSLLGVIIGWLVSLGYRKVVTSRVSKTDEER